MGFYRFRAERTEKERDRNDIYQEAYQEVKDENPGFMDRLRNSRIGKYLTGLAATAALTAGIYATDITKPKEAEALTITLEKAIYTPSSERWLLKYLGDTTDTEDTLWAASFPFDMEENGSYAILENTPLIISYSEIEKRLGVSAIGLQPDEIPGNFEFMILVKAPEDQFSIQNVVGEQINIDSNNNLNTSELYTQSLQPRTPAPVPEPASALFLASGIIAMAGGLAVRKKAC